MAINPTLDISIYETGNGGDMNLRADDIDIVKGFANQIYLALFGGNVEENTTESSSEQEQRKDWWGNELIEGEKFNSNFERALLVNPLNSAGISALENAAKEDLKFLKEYGTLTIEGSLIGVGKFQLSVGIQEPDSKTTKIKFLWDGAKQEIIEQIII